MSVCIAEWEGRKNEQKRSENILQLLWKNDLPVI